MLDKICIYIQHQQVVESDTPCKSTLLAVERDTPCISVLQELLKETPFTSTIHVEKEGYTSCPCCWWWKGKPHHVHTIDCRQQYTLMPTLLTVNSSTPLCPHVDRDTPSL
jgi:hypothetical protein